MEFLRTQLLPLLEEKYAHGERWYVGHSFSSLLGFQALFSHPELFTRWLLASPSIWWDNRAPLDAEELWAASHDDLDAAIFMAIGGLEPDLDPEGTRYDMVANMQELERRLQSRGYPRLQVTSRVLPGETHSSTIGTALSAGLRWLHKAD